MKEFFITVLAVIVAVAVYNKFLKATIEAA